MNLDIGKKIQLLRTYFDMTQGQLADKAGLSLWTIVYIEGMKGTNPRRTTLDKIQDALAVDLDTVNFSFKTND